MTEDLTDDPGNRVKQGSRERLVRSSVCQGRALFTSSGHYRSYPRFSVVSLPLLVVLRTFRRSFCHSFTIPSADRREVELRRTKDVGSETEPKG